MPTVSSALGLESAVATEASSGDIFGPGLYLGFAIVTTIPALFWTLILAFVGPWIGISLSLGALVIVGTVIAAFLSVIFGAVARSA